VHSTKLPLWIVIAARDEGPRWEPLDGGASTHRWACAPARGSLRYHPLPWLAHRPLMRSWRCGEERKREGEKMVGVRVPTNSSRFWLSENSVWSSDRDERLTLTDERGPVGREISTGPMAIFSARDVRGLRGRWRYVQVGHGLWFCCLGRFIRMNSEKCYFNSIFFKVWFLDWIWSNGII
jgi:hypothetical protein